MSEASYLSSDDSALLRRSLGRYRGGSCLEIGAGNGGALVQLSRRFRRVVGTDLRRPSDDSWNKAGADFVLADAASCFREGAFDLVAFNPPYLQSDHIVDPAVDGGPGGLAVALRFLRQAVRVLRRGGRIVMLLSSENAFSRFAEECDRNGLTPRALDKERLFFEELTTYELSRR